MIANRSYDCIVIGGGPGGCAAAALIAEQGHSTLLVERDKMPRFHVGESLMPEAYWLFERLGILSDLEKVAFTRKNGVQFVSSGDKESKPFIFSEHDDGPSTLSWHVQRAKFDNFCSRRPTTVGRHVLTRHELLTLKFVKAGLTR